MMMKYLIKSCFLSWIFLTSVFLLFGCSEEQTETQVTNTVKKSKPPTKKVADEEVAEEVEAVPKRFVYSPTGRRDPFEPLIKKDGGNRNNDVPLTPLQRFDIGQFRLQAVLIGKGRPRAMVSAPDGKTYILTPGIKIGKREGVVTGITRESVQIDEIYYDVTGTASRKSATIALPEQKAF